MRDLHRSLERSAGARRPLGEPGRIPVVALPTLVPAMALSVTPPRAAAAAALHGQLARVLAAADPWSGHPALVHSLATVAGLAERLREGLAEGMAPIEASAAPAGTPSQPYFRTRTLPLTARQTLVEGLGVLARAAGDIGHAPLAAHDVAAELAALRQALEYWADAAGVSGAEADIQPPAPPPHASGAFPDCVWAERWLIGHHCRFFLEATATALITRAATRVRRRQPQQAAVDLARATVCVQGLPAAVAHACALPTAHYSAEIRPGLDTPAQPQPLSGRMHLTYRHYRRALSRLLRELPTPLAELGAQHPGLARARTALLHADLIDGERHVHIAYTMLGTARSLAQHPASHTNAVTELRRISHSRARRYASLLRPSAHS